MVKSKAGTFGKRSKGRNLDAFDDFAKHITTFRRFSLYVKAPLVIDGKKHVSNAESYTDS